MSVGDLELLFFSAVMRVCVMRVCVIPCSSPFEALTDAKELAIVDYAKELAIVDLVYSRVRSDADLRRAAEAVFVLSGEASLHDFLITAVYGAESSEARARLDP